MRTPAISVRDLTIGYQDKTILEHLTFDVPQGQILAILGGSGCGKSTLLKHIIGLYDPLEGDVFLNGRSIVHADETERMGIMRSFGVAYQSGALFRSMSVFENVALPMREFTDMSETEIRACVERKLALVHLEHAGDLMPSDLSGGMIKRAAFARAMALDPQILFFDEPSAGLDPVSSAELDRLILNIRSRTGATILLVTHELPSIFAVADRALVLDKATKSILADGAPAELKQRTDLPFVYDFLNRNIPE